ncbi:MAG TPA: DUF3037 domain-containing protein [Terriglobales bacterium]|nr:DUF3037 domain-containing protein [Terriglobales bacterium]
MKLIPMSTTDLKLEFYLLRYVPYLVSGQFVDIGVLLFEPQPHGFGYADVRMTSDWGRVYRLDKEVDIEVLQDLEPYIRMQLRHSQDVALLVRKFEESFANMIQISARHVCLAAEPTRELERLRSIYLEEPQLESLPAAGRQKGEYAIIHHQIKDAFTRAGIWGLCIEKTAAAEYTKKRGDPLVFDFGYVVGTEVRFFQAVPLKTNTNQAVILAHRFPKVADSIHARNGSRALLTAVVANDLDRASPDIEFALDAFNDNSVHVATVADMSSIADQTREDLNALGGIERNKS